MALTPAGNEWLKVYFGLSNFTFTHSSFIGTNDSVELTSQGNIEQVYGLRYAPNEETPLAHLAFALKYDDISLDFLQAVFARIMPEEIGAFITETPGGKYARKIGFLYEFLTGKAVAIQPMVTGNYIDLLDADKYLIGKTGLSYRKSRGNVSHREKECIEKKEIKSGDLFCFIPPFLFLLCAKYSFHLFPAFYKKALHLVEDAHLR